MSRRTRILVAAGVGAVVAGAALVLTGASAERIDSGLFDFGVIMVGLFGALVLLWMLGSNGSEQAAEAEPMAWADVGPLTEQSPERTPSEFPLASQQLTATVERASERAREERHPEPGLAVVRERLREPFVQALVVGGLSRPEAERAVDEGTWTDDPVAAATLSGELWPAESRRQRLRNWLFPAREVRERTRRTVAELADVAEETIPTVVGEDAPRRIPVRPPTLEEMQRGADGELQPADETAFGYRWEDADETFGGESA